MTDEEIKKALECCAADNCDECPLFDFPKLIADCMPELLKSAFYLINRQQAEIEKLENDMRSKVVKCITSDVENAKTEAIKEFAEHLRKRIYVVCGRCAVDVAHINMVEKMLLEGGVNND